jgi:hypothetical protein
LIGAYLFDGVSLPQRVNESEHHARLSDLTEQSPAQTITT